MDYGEMLKIKSIGAELGKYLHRDGIYADPDVLPAFLIPVELKEEEVDNEVFEVPDF